MSEEHAVESLWTAGQAARYLNVSPRWVYDHASMGKLPCVRFGGHVRFDPAAVREYASGGADPGRWDQ